jgi:hypothetical protein
MSKPTRHNQINKLFETQPREQVNLTNPQDTPKSP